MRYRTYDKYHIITTELQPGYYDKDTLILEANFCLLTSFVEEECALMEHYFSERTKNWKDKLPRIIRKTFFPIHSRELGLRFIDSHINHEISEEDRLNMGFDTEESYQEYIKDYSAPWKEIKELYLWWKDVRPKREDPLEQSGFTAYCDSRREKYGGLLDNMKEEKLENGEVVYRIDDKETEEEKKLGSKLAQLSHEIEEEQHKEDDDMLIRLIKVRRNLWT